MTPARIAAALVATVLLAGCAGKVMAPVDASTDAAVPTAQESVALSPLHVVWLVSSTWNRLDWVRYGNLLTDDFQFVFAAADSAGSTFRSVPFTRDDEITIARHMFETGTVSEPPFGRVLLTFGSTLTVLADPRPGKDPRFHRFVRAPLTLLADTGAIAYRLSGAAGLYMVRGDSARIPPALIARGARPDSARWWLERWEDETLDPAAGPGSAAMPSRITTLGRLKALYR